MLTDFFSYLFLERLGGSWNHHLSLPWNKPKVFNALEKNWFIGIFVKVLQISLVFFMIFLLSYLLIVLTVRQFWIEAKSCSKSKTSFYSIKVKFFLISQFNWQYSCVFDSLTVSWHLCCWVQWLVCQKNRKTMSEEKFVIMNDAAYPCIDWKLKLTPWVHFIYLYSLLTDF